MVYNSTVSGIDSIIVVVQKTAKLVEAICGDEGEGGGGGQWE